ncbi:MAG: hypothetical protein EPN39_19230 [Chitinophagaceae bacterium]|nr:MAG: hypothetical protein EPN39_19230 [Chitinophagaceae bacterium]
MKSFSLWIAVLILLAPLSPAAQNNHEIIYKKTGTMAISGNLMGFPDSLMQPEPKTGISWLFANDENNLFIFLKANDKRIQNSILMHGITVGINVKGKKKTKSSLIFPVIDQEALMAQMSALRNSGSALASDEFENIQKERLSQFNEIKVDGLKKIDNGDIPLSNQYGIEAKILYDSAGDLLYEMKIPFQYVNLSSSLKHDIAVNIKMNGFDFKNGQRNYSGTAGSGSWNGGRGMGRGGGGFHGRGNGHHITEETHSSGKATTAATDFWIKAPLAQ